MFWTQINPLTLRNVGGRVAGIASQSGGAWQATLFSYDTDGRVVKRYTYTESSSTAGQVLAAVSLVDSLVLNLQGAPTERRLVVGSSPFNHWYEYDGRGLLWKVFAGTGTKPASPDVTYTYRPSGLPASRQFLGGPVVPVTYTIREQLHRIGDPAGTLYPFSARYAYHANGMVSESEFYNAGTPTGATKRYRYVYGTASYDALNRLKSADFSSWSGSSWTSTLAHDLTNIAYDRAGNLTTLRRYRQNATLIDNLTYTTPTASNRLGSISDAVATTPETWDAETGSFTYDASGNLKTSPAPYSITAATYDHMNLPLSFTKGGVVSAYRYDHDAQRITKRVGTGNTQVYLRDGPVTLAVFTVNGSGTVVSSYFNLLSGTRVAGRQPTGAARRYYHTDLLGSTRTVVQGATVVEAYDYDPWGVLMPGRTLGSGTKEGFTGNERDAETGLDYFGFRYYMAAIGRWTSVDPPADSFPSWNPYNYVENNPINFWDPFGLCPQSETGRPCTLGDVFRYSVTIGGQIGGNLTLFGVGAFAHAQAGPVVGVQLSGEGASVIETPTLYASIQGGAELPGNIELGYGCATEGGCGPTGEAGGGPGGQAQRGRTKIGVAVGVGAAIDVNQEAAREVAGRALGRGRDLFRRDEK